MRTPRSVLAAGLVCVLGTGVPSPPTVFGQTRDPTGQPFGQPAGDPSTLGATNGLATLSGRVLTADTGAVVKRAMVILANQDTRDGRTAETDGTGRYQFADLQEGRYTVRVNKAGFTTIAYGQKHPRQPALPIRIDAGQQLRNVDIALPRGSVITGQVVDEDGEPMTRAIVQVLRYGYRQGQRQIERGAGNDQTDDRGQFRVFDLEPGDYFVSVTMPRPRLRAGRGGPGGRGARAGRGRRPGPVGPPEESVEGSGAVGLAPTYYPGVTMLRDATPLTVGLSQEVSGVNFAAQLVRMARVSGTVFAPDGSPARGTQVWLSSADPGARVPGSVSSGRVGRDGSFELRDVPPGSYTVRAQTGRARQSAGQLLGSRRVTVDGQDITALTLMLRRGAEMHGRLSFDGTQIPEPSDLERLRVTTSQLDPNPTPFGRRGEGGVGVEPDASFTLRDIGGGPRLIRMDRLGDDLRLKAVYVDGRDVIDVPREFDAGRVVSGVTLVLTDRVTELTGMVHDDRGNALTAFTVIAFPTDERLWRPQSRHVMASRPDQNAQYRMRGLPPGNYLLSVVEVVEEGEWFDPPLLADLRRRAARVTLRDGDSKSLGLSLEASR